MATPIPNAPNAYKKYNDSALIAMAWEDDANGAVHQMTQAPDSALAGDCKQYKLDGLGENLTWLQKMQNLNKQFRVAARANDIDNNGKLDKMVLVSHGYGDGAGGLSGGWMQIENADGDDMSLRVEDVADQAARYIEPGGELVLVGCGYCVDTPEGRATLKRLKAIAKHYGINIKVTTTYANAGSYASGEMKMITPYGQVMDDNSVALREQAIREQEAIKRDTSIWDDIASIWDDIASIF